MPKTEKQQDQLQITTSLRARKGVAISRNVVPTHTSGQKIATGLRPRNDAVTFCWSFWFAWVVIVHGGRVDAPPLHWISRIPCSWMTVDGPSRTAFPTEWLIVGAIQESPAAPTGRKNPLPRGAGEECGRKGESQYNQKTYSDTGRCNTEQVFGFLIIERYRPHSSSVTSRFRRADWRQLLPGRSVFARPTGPLQRRGSFRLVP